KLEVINVGSVRLKIQFSPRVFLGDVARSEIHAVDQLGSDVLKRSTDTHYFAGSTARNSARKTTWVVHNLLRRNLANQVPYLDLVPISVGRKPVRPSPPAPIWVSGTRRPHRPQIVSVGVFRV